MELEQVAESIRTGEYREEVREFRTFFPLMTIRGYDADGTITSFADRGRNLPRMCFAQEQENRNGEQRVKAYTGLVLLEVNNLTGRDEAEAVRRGAAEMPQTLLAFVGADGQSVKIVCRGESMGVRVVMEIITT